MASRWSGDVRLAPRVSPSSLPQPQGDVWQSGRPSTAGGWGDVFCTYVIKPRPHSGTDLATMPLRRCFWQKKKGMHQTPWL